MPFSKHGEVIKSIITCKTEVRENACSPRTPQLLSQTIKTNGTSKPVMDFERCMWNVGRYMSACGVVGSSWLTRVHVVQLVVPWLTRVHVVQLIVPWLTRVRVVQLVVCWLTRVHMVLLVVRWCLWCSWQFPGSHACLWCSWYYAGACGVVGSTLAHLRFMHVLSQLRRHACESGGQILWVGGWKDS